MTENTFFYRHFQINDNRHTVQFYYRLSHGTDTHDFTETLEFPVPLLDTPAQHASLRALHIALGISYYKIFVADIIEHPYEMSGDEATFWNDVWQNGLGEFLYVNKLSADKLAKFTGQGGTGFPVGARGTKTTGAILGIGGGKDSIVACELLKDCDVAIQGFVMATGEQLGQAKAVADTMEIPIHIVKRNIDKQLLTVQEQPGAFKGHIPISLIFGLVGTALAIALDNEYVVVANEASASIPRTTWGKMAVNHQWSKSFGFEKKLQKYIQNGIDPQITYFSAVRQLTSIGVAKLFSHYPKYYEVFTSDNFVFRIDPTRRPNGRWSLESPKSLSSFILLAPWIEEPDMIKIFGLNFLNEAALEGLFLELTGLEGHPPLDCVGTVEELVLSLNLLTQQGKFTNSLLSNVARRRGILTDKDWGPELTDMLAVQPDHALPAVLTDTITTNLQKELRA
jgi:UDP-N-acetyl-alpha-D-muramoyl-L-alanyl-L-glutamate epimerase